MKKLTKAIAILGIVGVLTACGKSSSQVNVSADTKSDVKTVSVAVESGSKPLSFENDKGELTGYEVETLKAIDEIIKEYDFNIESVESSAVQVGLDAGKYALIGGGMYRTPEREEKYLLTDEITGVSLVTIYVREDDESIKTLDDLVGKKVAPSSPNGGMYNLLTQYNKEHPDKQITIETAEGASLADRFKSIESGEYDATVIPNNLGFNELKKELNLKIKAVEEPVKANPTYFLLGKTQTDLKEKVDAALKELRESGKLSELSIKWYGEDNIKYYK